MAKFRIRISDIGILGKTSTINIDFEVASDDDARDRYATESKSCREFNDIEYGYMHTEGLFRIDQLEIITRIL